MKYLESYSESVIKINDIKDLFVEFSNGVNINSNKFTISVVKLKSSDLDHYKNNSYNETGKIIKSIDFTDFENKPKFEVLIKSNFKLGKRVFNSAYKPFDIVDMYDELKEIEDYLLTTNISIKYIQIVHTIKLPKRYSSSHAMVTSQFSNNASYIENSNTYGGNTEVEYIEVSIIDKIKPMKSIKSIKFIIF